MGKAMSDVNYYQEDLPSAYNNAAIHSHLTEYTPMAREVHGPQYDPSIQGLDGEVVMMVGGGKKHGQYWIGDNTLVTATFPKLSQIRARSTSSSPAIRLRPDTAQFWMEALHVISVSFVVHCFLHTFAFHCNNGVKYCRPSQKKRVGYGRRWHRGWRLIDRGWKPSGRGWS
jgi:hypothetical protein